MVLAEGGQFAAVEGGRLLAPGAAGLNRSPIQELGEPLQLTVTDERVPAQVTAARTGGGGGQETIRNSGDTR